MRPPLCLPLRAVTALLLVDVAVAEAFGHVVYNHGATCVGFNALPACFGPPLPTEGLVGYLIEATPANACHPIAGPPASSNSSEAFIVLIRRSDCPFGVKVLHAQQAGFQAAIVHNVNAEHLVNMASDDEAIRQQIAIQSVFTGESARKHLRRASPYEKGAYVTLMAPKNHLIPYLLQEFGFMLNVLICTIPLVACARWCTKGQQITVCTFKRGDRYDTCVICMAEYEEGDQLKVLPCSHTYHCACIDTWLHTQPRNKTCPFCKQQDHAGEGDDEEGHDDESVEGEEEE
uniref:RING-type E3 ubiquitin transferase n=1 Tax=Pelodiscus sinensis TaxID=13735 RepID=K7G3G0_PELSI